MSYALGNHLAAKWLPEHDVLLKQLHDRGFSGSQSAEELNRKFQTDYSRNAVIGRKHRLKLSEPMTKRSPKEPKPRPPRPDRAFHAKPILPPPDTVRLRCLEVIPRGLTLLELGSGECKYPYGNAAPFAFCGHPALEDKPYCMRHQHLTTRVS